MLHFWRDQLQFTKQSVSLMQLLRCAASPSGLSLHIQTHAPLLRVTALHVLGTPHRETKHTALSPARLRGMLLWLRLGEQLSSCHRSQSAALRGTSVEPGGGGAAGRSPPSPKTAGVSRLPAARHADRSAGRSLKVVCSGASEASGLQLVARAPTKRAAKGKHSA